MRYRPIMFNGAEEFVVLNGGEPHLDHGMFAYPHGCSKAGARRAEKRMDTQFAKVHELQGIYYQILGMGIFREPTEVEKMVRTARGFHDRPSVQAARRVCVRRGVTYTDPKWDYLENLPILSS